MSSHKLSSNIPVFGLIKYVDYFPAKEKDGQQYSAQIRLRGKWEGLEAQDIYVSDQLVEGLITSGLMQSLSEKMYEGKMIPQFRWLYQGRVQVLKAEEGRSKRTSILPVDAALAKIAKPQTTSTTTASPLVANTINDQWSALERTYGRAQNIAVKAWGDEFDPKALVAAAASIFIEANKKGLIAEPTKFEQPPAALQQDEDEESDLPF